VLPISGSASRQARAAAALPFVAALARSTSARAEEEIFRLRLIHDFGVDAVSAAESRIADSFESGAAASWSVAAAEPRWRTLSSSPRRFRSQG